MRGNSHVRFGERAEETDQSKDRHRASVRLDHTHASLLVKAGVPIKVVSERLGHAHPGFTMATYQHVLPGMQADAARALRTTRRARLPPASDATRWNDRWNAPGEDRLNPVERRRQRRRPRSLTWAFLSWWRG